jgi:hypothetical protein
MWVCGSIWSRQPDLLHLGDDFLARGKPVHAVELFDHLDQLALDLQTLEEILIVLERHRCHRQSGC